MRDDSDEIRDYSDEIRDDRNKMRDDCDSKEREAIAKQNLLATTPNSSWDSDLGRKAKGELDCVVELPSTGYIYEGEKGSSEN